jgi:hypothetical protein
MELFILGAIAYLVTAIFARFEQEKAVKLLTDEERGQFMTASASSRKLTTIILAVIILVFLVLGFYASIERKLLVYSYFGGIAVFLLASTLILHTKIRKIGFAGEFMKRYTLSMSLTLLARIILFVSAGYYILSVNLK